MKIIIQSIALHVLKKSRFGCRLYEKRWGKSGVDMGVKEHFSLAFFVQDAPNRRFPYKREEL